MIRNANCVKIYYDAINYGTRGLCGRFVDKPLEQGLNLHLISLF